MDVVKLQQTFGILFLPFSFIYRIVVIIRRLFWKLGIQERYTLSCPCISVGNISWGGTGKTPVVDWLLDWAESKKLQPVVLTRGYKSTLRSYPLCVANHHTAGEVGDEPLMLARSHPEVSVLVDPNRVRSGKYAEQKFKPDLVVLDDGFQYLSLAHSLDLVLLHENDLTTGWNKVIPTGSWREDSLALKNVSAFLIKANREKMEALMPVIEKRLFQFGKPVFSFYLKPLYLQQNTSLRQVPLSDFFGKPYILLTGIGNPKQALQTIERYIGTPPQRHLIFSDHHRYTFHDVHSLCSMDMPIICTMKDFVKLQSLPIPDLFCIQIETVFEGFLWSHLSFSTWISKWWSNEQKITVKSLGHFVNKNTGFDPSCPLSFGERAHYPLVENEIEGSHESKLEEHIADADSSEVDVSISHMLVHSESNQEFQKKSVEYPLNIAPENIVESSTEGILQHENMDKKFSNSEDVSEKIVTVENINIDSNASEQNVIHNLDINK